MSEALTPRELVSELDKFIVGQADAKRAVAIAVRNRWRRKRLDPELQGEVTPKNIIMIGPTGVGKTEIARRLAALVRSPFVKVEASKFTEVGYVGRDVESMVRDLVDAAVAMVKQERMQGVRPEAQAAAEERLLDLLLPDVEDAGQSAEERAEERARRQRNRERFRAMLREGKLDEREVEVTTEPPADPNPAGALGALGVPGAPPGPIDLKGLLERLGGRRPLTRRLRVPAALRALTDEEAARRVDAAEASAEGLARAESDGIIFLDEVDKICAPAEGAARGADISRQGVQRDLLPVVEGTTVHTRHGALTTDHILFVAAGAFHTSKPSDLIPELQGRFPIRVELAPLGKEELRRILVEPRAALTRQYTALLEAEGVTLRWEPDGVEALAELARDINARTDDIGARRLHTVLERLLERELFEAPDLRGREVVVTAALVRDRLAGLAGDEDLSRYIL